ncbi:hypothetical protein BD309DRAFT_969072 [Dichomitus squalens]|nr:hypothetical protein BD309DRAFT_969072 [Dichomitus squalens]
MATQKLCGSSIALLVPVCERLGTPLLARSLNGPRDHPPQRQQSTIDGTSSHASKAIDLPSLFPVTPQLLSMDVMPSSSAFLLSRPPFVHLVPVLDK